MPENLNLNTPVTPDFKLNTQLREFFINNLEFIGFKKPFKFCFNQALRDFFKNPPEKSILKDALICYQNSLKLKLENPDQPIGKQFEYNQHMRDFFRDNPGKSMKEAREAWWKRRGGFS